jgi:ABC-type amino acid transport substrate-binding protein
VDGTRSALIVASDDYTDPGLRRLRAPASDAQALAGVLRDPGIGGFEVRTLLNEPAYAISEAVEEFFDDRSRDDLLLLHFSCHGVKDEGGELYFAAANTKLRRLGATAVAAEFVNRRMNRSRSRRVVLLLDCCYAGAFERGMTARAGTGVAIEEQFGGRGRAVITASSAMEYAFEGDELADARELAPSVFTSALVEGLETGEADRDQDGLVGLDELYDYIYDRVKEATPNQTPGKWMFGVQGELVIARRARPVTTPAPLLPELQQAIASPFAAVRAGAVQELTRLLQSPHAGLALAAKLALERLSEDDSRTVSAAATAALNADVEHPAVTPTPTTPVARTSEESAVQPNLPEEALDSTTPASSPQQRPNATVADVATSTPRLRHDEEPLSMDPARRRARMWIVAAACVVLLIAGVAILLLATSRNQPPTGGASSRSSPTTLVAGVDQALAARVPTAIKSDGKIKIGTESSYAPGEFLDTDGKTVIGFDVDLFNAVAAKLGLKTQWQSAVFDAIIPGIKSGKYEMGVSSFTINDERKKQVNMVSYFNAGTQWGTKKGNLSGVQPDDACGKKVAVQTNTVQDTEDLPKRQQACRSAGKPALTVDSYQAQDQATAAVVSGKDDAFLADSPVVAYAVKQTNGQLELLGDIYDAAPYGYVIKRDQTDFAQAVAGAVKELISDGTYKRILEKWGVEAGAIDNPAANP